MTINNQQQKLNNWCNKFIQEHHRPDFNFLDDFKIVVKFANKQNKSDDDMMQVVIKAGLDEFLIDWAFAVKSDDIDLTKHIVEILI